MCWAIDCVFETVDAGLVLVNTVGGIAGKTNDNLQQTLSTQPQRMQQLHNYINNEYNNYINNEYNNCIQRYVINTKCFAGDCLTIQEAGTTKNNG